MAGHTVKRVALHHQFVEFLFFGEHESQVEGMTRTPDDSVFQEKAARALRSNESADVLLNYHTKRLT